MSRRPLDGDRVLRRAIAPVGSLSCDGLAPLSIWLSHRRLLATRSVINFPDPLRRSLTQDDPTRFAAPAQFGPFRVLHQIGVGALGPVFRTYEPERDRLIAVKAFRLDITPEQAHALAAELSRAAEAGLFHPSIVEPIAAGVEGTLAYGAEEYVAAESLDVAMRHYAPASIDTVLLFITQLAGAIDFARAAGVGHGALHPRDIFITPEEARATGFGVVEALERVGVRAPVRRPYSPPERVGGQAWSTPADVFSLGVIAFELLTGRRPSGLGEEIGAINAGTPNQWMDAIRAVLVRSMSEDPDARFPTALAFASALEVAARGDASTVAVTESAPSPVVTASDAPAKLRAVVPGPPTLVAGASVENDRRVGDPPSKPQVQDADAEVDDVSAERDEDTAHHQLTLREAEAATRQEPDLRLGVDSEAEAEADNFLVDVAAAASVPTTPLDDFRTKDSGRSVRARPDRSEDAERTEPVPYAPVAYTPIEHTALRSSRAPIAVVLVIGLLVGLAGGYALWGRSPRTPSPSAPADRAASSSGANKPSSATREFSEQVVAPKPGPPPPGGSSPAASTARTPAAPAPTTGNAAAAASNPATPVRATTGTITVESSPAGAAVVVNGDWRGRTPLKLEKLPFARYNVRVVREGYAPASNAVALSVGEPTQTLSFRLQQTRRPAAPERRASASDAPAPASSTGTFTGSIYVDSRPRGARVSIDGKSVGVTPLRVGDVRIGTRIVRLELPDYRIWSSTARVAAGQESRVTGSLERIQ
jgi:serine/threonine protein kinase